MNADRKPFALAIVVGVSKFTNLDVVTVLLKVASCLAFRAAFLAILVVDQQFRHEANPELSCVSQLGKSHHPDESFLDKRLVTIDRLEKQILSAEMVKIATRGFTLPVTFGDPSVKVSLHKHMETVRSRALYLPDNNDSIPPLRTAIGRSKTLSSR